ncbi:Acetyltransferase, including N-acetylase of ribosomal protein [Pseudomonas caricapapayae]|uniref:Acetyltransferase, including N-acetylase of ribosomal protein n=4 Tax=Pseudomonas syringae group TaxID=136849 RepID=A0A3M3B5E3_9PSED|nr:Acetyltransferase domain protein [Pseudomonas syringae pv. tagetis]RMM07860.1 Acetyltransferase, including N-acetylase of ribosomal protein [Pseudomonas caricapapayae]RMV98142.1 Acetyltransferase, including N-acetylase of ribosomal protein [Pseudomonas caricapapayae]RMW23807.1 Acetyltransferase domain protein [Pseudomonas syringae pv. tagetis]
MRARQPTLMTKTPHECLIPTPTLYTPRLVLRPVQLEDAAVMQTLFNQWEVVRYLTHHVPWPYPDGEALRHIREDVLPAMQNGEEWHWSIRLSGEQEPLIGAACMMDEEDNNRGFWLSTPYQGLGLMSEVCVAIDRFWFETLKRPVLRVAKSALNEASYRLSQREGMRLVTVQEAQFVCGTTQEQIWELTRQEWRANNGVQ